MTHEHLIKQLHIVWDEDLRGWRSPVGNTSQWTPASAPFRVLVAFAVDQARPIIEDGAANDEELADLLPVAEDESFPEDAALARVIQGRREEAFTYALTLNFDRRWQD